ncbi:aryl-sulfate sulfotransferase [candidate division KSB1 bacterium]|nr:aryl-sulfate sulfotransferase [candidate division KSB1 bacterium]
MSLRKIILVMGLYLISNSVLISAYPEQGYQYLHPKPDAKYASEATTLIIRFESISPDQVQNLDKFISVSGEESGIHFGKSKIASDQKTVIFTPDEYFQPGETVTVTLAPIIQSSSIESINYQFTVIASSVADYSVLNEVDERESIHRYEPSQKRPSSQATILPNGVSVPSDFPHVEITVNDNPSSDYIFIDNRGGGPGRPYNVIFDNTGSPVWYIHPNDERRDFKVQPNGWITMLIRGGYGGSGWGHIALDGSYDYVKTFRATNGYTTDEHELQVLEDGGWLVIGRRDVQNVDLSSYGGNPNATVRETCIQEYTANDELIFQWAAFDHFNIGDLEGESLNSSYIRFPHMNAIDIDDDGHIILSSRHLSEISKIHRNSGEFIWRLSGAHNQFTFVNDPLQGTRNQHAARALGGGVYTAFDNGNGHNPPISRAVKYQINTSQMTATLIWSYNEDGWFSQHMSNAQQLSNGNMLINWGQSYLPKLTEIRPDGSKAFHMDFVYNSECYRVHRCAWNGMAEVPVLDVEPAPDNITLLMNKFGDPDVDYYRIYSGRSQNPTTVFDTSNTSLKKIYNLDNGYHWIRVTAVDNGGLESGYSNQEQVYVSFVTPGTNLVQNGDFSNGQNDWTWELQGAGDATWSIVDGAANIQITNGGSAVYAVQLRQNNIPLIQGNTYMFEFDASADASRTIEAKVGQDSSPYTNYSQIGPTFITPIPDRFSYEFDMESASDANGRVVFNMGESNANVTIDNVRVGQKLEQYSFLGSPHELPGTIQCEEYDFGGEGIAYHDDDARSGNPEYRPDDNVDVETADDVDGGYNIGYVNPGEWLEYTVNVESGIYNIEYRVASDPGGGVLEVELDGESLATFNVESTGDWQEYVTLTQSGVELEGDDNIVLRLNIIEEGQNLNWLRFVNTTSNVPEKSAIPLNYALHQNYPNPFNPETRIDYQIPAKSDVLIRIYNVAGKLVSTLLDEALSSGQHQVLWDGRDSHGVQQASGLYLISMQAGSFKAVRKITLLR